MNVLISLISKSQRMMSTVTWRWTCAAALVVFLPIASIQSFVPEVDGTFQEFVILTLGCLAFGIAGSVAITSHVGMRHILVPSMLVGVTLLPVLSHVGRLSNPYLHGTPIETAVGSHLSRGSWTANWEYLAAGDQSTPIQLDNSLLINVTPWKSASIRAIPQGGPPVAVWQLPLRGSLSNEYQSLNLQVTTNRQGMYLGLIQANRLRVQLVPYGIKISHPDERNDISSTDIRNMSWSDGASHKWSLRGSIGTLTLLLDGSELWRDKQREPLLPLLIGDPQADGEHGGVVHVHAALYERGIEKIRAQLPPHAQGDTSKPR